MVRKFYNYFKIISYEPKLLGLTTFFGTSSQYYIGNGSTNYRVLLRFENLTHFIPSGSVIVQSAVTIFLSNWVDTELQACALTKHWDKALFVP